MPATKLIRKKEVVIGTIKAFVGLTPPQGWVVCDGSTLNRTQYSRLFNVIGTAHGPGNGSTTFHIPDLRGRFLRGLSQDSNEDNDKNSRTFSVIGGNVGNNVGSIQGDAIRNITGQWPEDSNATSTSGVFQRTGPGVGNNSGDGTGGANRWSFNASRVVPTSTENRPINVNVIYIIKIE
jgi:hypothetical protein